MRAKTMTSSLAVLLVPMLLAAAAGPTTAPRAAEVETLKERLSDKASDEQRVDNCRVPPERRGPKPRPGCRGAAAPASAAANAADGDGKPGNAEPRPAVQ